MHSKNYYAKPVQLQGLGHFKLQEQITHQTQQKVSKYYSTHDDATVKKKLIDHYDKPSSTHDSNYYHHNDTLLNQLQENIQSYKPVFSETSVKKRPNYAPLSLQICHPQITPTIQQQMPQINQPQQINFAKFEEINPRIPKNHVSRFDRQISALYKQNRNINLQYRKRKFMQIFLKSEQN